METKSLERIIKLGFRVCIITENEVTNDPLERHSYWIFDEFISGKSTISGEDDFNTIMGTEITEFMNKNRLMESEPAFNDALTRYAEEHDVMSMQFSKLFKWKLYG